jgi:hypothetical protein
MEGCMEGGFNVVRHDPSNELMVMNNFRINVNLVVNGEVLTQQQLVEKLYYSEKTIEMMKNNEFVVNKSMPSKNIKHEIPDAPKPLESGQVDPATFFNNSAVKNLFGI